jgi:Flp pilus assembly CpaF family ATPase
MACCGVIYLCGRAGFEPHVPLPDVVAMQTRQPNFEGAGEIPLRRLVKEALRMRPSRIVIGECARRSAST